MNQRLPMDQVLLYFSLKYSGCFDPIMEALQNKEDVDIELFNQLKEKMDFDTYNYATIISPDYPEQLKQIDHPPFVIYYKGNLNLLKNHSVALMGSSELPLESIVQTKELARSFIKKGNTLITGNTSEVDAVIVSECLYRKGNNVIILQDGITTLDKDILIELEEMMSKDYLILSEYPFQLEEDPKYKFHRNRLIAGLCNQLIVIESEIKRSILFAVYCAIEVGRDVFCMSSSNPAFSKGISAILKMGANLLTDKEQLNSSLAS